MPPTTNFGRILLADDDPDARGAVRVMLEREGYACAEAESGEGVRTLLEKAEFDLIIADICMPGNDHLEMVEPLAARDHPMRVILVTGCPTIETAMYAMKLRADGYLAKPVDGAELLGLVGHTLAIARTAVFVRSHRHKLESLLVEMNQLERLAQVDSDAALSSYASLCMQHVLISLSDLRAVVESLTAREDDAEMSRRFGAARPFLLLDAIRDTVQVLERSKSSFKSRELAELRQRLETLLAPAARAPRPPASDRTDAAGRSGPIPTMVSPCSVNR